MPAAPATPPPPQAAITPACSICGAQGTLVTKQEPITTKKRPKFGVFWILVSLISLGLGLILYLIWPRHKETIGVDRWTECRQCGARV